MKSIRVHKFHILPADSNAISTSISLYTVVLSILYALAGGEYAGSVIMWNLFGLLSSVYFWWSCVIREGKDFKLHTLEVVRGLRLGFILFIVSEIMLFFSFFWAFFHSSLSPVDSIGCMWPPFGHEVINPWKLPYVNTLLLLTSGATLTLAHKYLLLRQSFNKVRRGIILPLIATLILALTFLYIQLYEYTNSPFSINNGIYGSTFYMLTGLHGLHVLGGTVFIFVQGIRFFLKHFTPISHFGFEASIWYWHFVDVVWIFLFIFVYC